MQRGADLLPSGKGRKLPDCAVLSTMLLLAPWTPLAEAGPDQPGPRAVLICDLLIPLNKYDFDAFPARVAS